jgi:hypothetical protein
LCEALHGVYPEQTWTKPYRGYWKDLNTQRSFFDDAAKALNITQPDDWYKVTVKQIFDLGGGFIAHYYNSSLITGKIAER